MAFLSYSYSYSYSKNYHYGVGKVFLLLQLIQHCNTRCQNKECLSIFDAPNLRQHVLNKAIYTLVKARKQQNGHHRSFQMCFMQSGLPTNHKQIKPTWSHSQRPLALLGKEKARTLGLTASNMTHPPQPNQKHTDTLRYTWGFLWAIFWYVRGRHWICSSLYETNSKGSRKL